MRPSLIDKGCIFAHPLKGPSDGNNYNLTVNTQQFYLLVSVSHGTSWPALNLDGLRLFHAATLNRSIYIHDGVAYRHISKNQRH